MTMTNGYRLRLRFWGVRGSIPTPSPANLRYGGNTSCVELELATGDTFVFDAGTGIRALGLSLMEQSLQEGIQVRVFLSHYHWDHIQGLPFFGPLYASSSKVSFFGPRGAKDPERTLVGQMQEPYFPVSLHFAEAAKTFVMVEEDPFKFGPVTIQPFPLNHPQGATGYRIEYDGAVIVYATDLEHGHAQLDSVFRDYSQNADILICDAQYTPAEYRKFLGWGHGTWLDATRAARDCRAQKLFLFHHDPSHNDELFPAIEREAQKHFECTVAAREGLELFL